MFIANAKLIVMNPNENGISKVAGLIHFLDNPKIDVTHELWQCQIIITPYKIHTSPHEEGLPLDILLKECGLKEESYKKVR